MTHLSKANLNPDPLLEFALWFEEANLAKEIEPTAMTLATVNAQYEVSARIVLLKEFNEKGFTFFTNYNSPKGTALSEIQNAALVFWWPKSKRQVRITGKVEKTDKSVSDRYFATRSKASCLAAIASNQSQEIPNRDFLMQQYEKLEAQYLNEEKIPCPSFWGGYILLPESIEFWQAGEHRLHSRFLYRKEASGWHLSQLSP